MAEVTSDRETWLAARQALLVKEKAHARSGAALAAERRQLPKLKLEKNYVFQATDGEVSFADLFEGRSQLIVQHFMFAPDAQEGCPMCSFWADGYNPMIQHMNQRDLSFVAVSRGAIDKIDAYRSRMGWDFRWVSSLHNDFNFDFEVSATEAQIESGITHYNYADVPVHSQEMHGTSAFERGAAGEIYHTYSTFGRGLDGLNMAYAYIDLSPKGRDEEGLPFSMAWVRRHDQYEG